MAPRSTLAELIADSESSAPAIIAPSPPTVVSYQALAEQVERLAGQLRGAGLEPGQCVGIVLPNGLEFLVIFLAVTRAGFVAAPLNPAYKAHELSFFMEDAQMGVVIAESGNQAVKQTATALGLARVDTRDRRRRRGRTRRPSPSGARNYTSAAF